MQSQPADYHDFVGILVLLVINSTISFIEENNAGNAAAALMARLAPKAKVFPFKVHRFIFKVIVAAWPSLSSFISCRSTCLHFLYLYWSMTNIA